jgi:hypothetical protein
VIKDRSITKSMSARGSKPFGAKFRASLKIPKKKTPKLLNQISALKAK